MPVSTTAEVVLSFKVRPMFRGNKVTLNDDARAVVRSDAVGESPATNVVCPRVHWSSEKAYSGRAD